jgi:type IV pilus assembly protein PilN
LIKINLLAIDRDRGKRKAKLDLLGSQVPVACTLILVLTGLGVGWWFWSLRREATDLTKEIADAQAETQRLQGVIQQVRQFEDQRAQLQQRVTLIEQLRKGQTGPVHLLDQVSRSLPEAMWLIDLKQTGNDVAIEGRCMTLNALSDFVSSLETSNYFERPVEIVDSSVEPGSPTTPELIKFSVKGKFKGSAN